MKAAAQFRRMRLLGWISCAISLLLCPGPGGAAEETAPPREEAFYRIIALPIPKGLALEAGALQVLTNDMLAASTRMGGVFLIEGAYEDPPARMTYKRFASGLHEVLGLAERDGSIYATQAGEVTRLRDADGVQGADLFETVCDEWGLSGDAHEYAVSSKFDKDGQLWVALCLTGLFTSEVPFRGWCLRVASDGRMTPSASGLYAPGGVGSNAAGDMFVTDNQGPWNGTSSLKHLRPGAFLGHPAGNKWYTLAEPLGARPVEPRSGSRMHVEMARIPQLVPPAVLFPHGRIGEAASGIACDITGGKFGPFKNQLFVGDPLRGGVMRVFLEKVNDQYQGASFMFRSGFGSGPVALEFGSDGSLFVYGANVGLNGEEKRFALERVVWAGRSPFEVHEMRAKPDGYDITFTQPVDLAAAGLVSSYRIETYTYIYQSEFGSPEVDRTEPVITRAVPAPDGRSVRLFIDGLQPGHVHELQLHGVRSLDGQPLLHDTAYYTLNQIPR